MLIKHISIINIENRPNDADYNDFDNYMVKFTLDSKPDVDWKRLFRLERFKIQTLTKKSIKILDNEIHIILGEGDDIQNCIETVKSIVNKVYGCKYEENPRVFFMKNKFDKSGYVKFKLKRNVSAM